MIVLAPDSSRGTLHGHVFENPATGLERDLFWSLDIGLCPITLDGEEWTSSVQIEWLTWPLGSWSDLDGKTLQEVRKNEFVECSVYLLDEHHLVELRQLTLRLRSQTVFQGSIEGTVALPSERGSIDLCIRGDFEVDFSGIILVSGNFQPRLTTAEQARLAITEFLSLDRLAEPTREDGRFVAKPTTPGL